MSDDLRWQIATAVVGQACVSCGYEVEPGYFIATPAGRSAWGCLTCVMEVTRSRQARYAQCGWFGPIP